MGKKNTKKSVEVAKKGNAIETLKEVAVEQRAEVASGGGPKTISPEQRERDVARLLHTLYNDESLTSKDKKTIRRTLRDTYNYYISRERKNAGNAVVQRILKEEAAA